MEITYYVLFLFDGQHVSEIGVYHPDRFLEAKHNFFVFQESGGCDYWLRKYTLTPTGSNWENVFTTMKD